MKHHDPVHFIFDGHDRHADHGFGGSLFDEGAVLSTGVWLAVVFYCSCRAGGRWRHGQPDWWRTDG